MGKELTKTDIKKIVNDEIKDFVSKELDKEIKKLVKKSNGDTRNEIVDIARNAIEKLAEFLWIRRSVWRGDIK